MGYTPPEPRSSAAFIPLQPSGFLACQPSKLGTQEFQTWAHATCNRRSRSSPGHVSVKRTTGPCQGLVRHQPSSGFTRRRETVTEPGAGHWQIDPARDSVKRQVERGIHRRRGFGSTTSPHGTFRSTQIDVPELARNLEEPPYERPSRYTGNPGPRRRISEIGSQTCRGNLTQ